jgi:RimJ/RimL family protein N-acetyltransferase
VASCIDPEICRWRGRPDPDLVEAMAYIRQRAGEWERDERCTWAVCEPTTGEMLGEVELASLDLDHGTAEAACWALPRARGRGMTTTALSAVLRFGFGGLGLQCVGYAWADGNAASARVAEKCGFRLEGRKPAATVVDGQQADVLVAFRLATDR